MKLGLSVCIGTLLLAGCATTQTSKTKSQDLVFTGFTPQTNGGQFHGGTGLLCPPTLFGLPIIDQTEYGSQSNDASCSYRDGNKIATVYLSELNEEFKDVFQGAVSSIFQGPMGDSIEIDEEATQTCRLGGLLMGAVSESGDTSPYVFDAAVLSSPKVITLAQLTELDSKFLKLRYTVLEASKSEGLNACIEGSKALRDVYDSTRARAQR